MRKIIFNALLYAVFSCVTAFGQHYLGADAENAVAGSKEVFFEDFTSVPTSLSFRKGAEIPLESLEPWLQTKFKLSDRFSLRLLTTERDELGMIHYRYQQTLDNVPIDLTMLLVHTKEGGIESMNGELLSSVGSILASAFAMTLSESDALKKAMLYFDAKEYVEENKTTFGSKTVTQVEGEKVYAPADGNLKSGALTLCWKFNLYATVPLKRSFVYVDSRNGKVVMEEQIIHHIDAQGTARTKYSGSRTIVADSYGTSYRLRESGRGNGVQTFDLNGSKNYSNAVDFTDSDNNWNFSGNDQGALDAHWGSEMTYDYYLQKHNRNSIDNNGFLLKSYCNYDRNYVNAFWNGQYMTYGDGNGTPLTAIDVVGHEITHGLTTFTANLRYQGESGALNESFSDIFGTAVEKKGRPDMFHWDLGKDINLTRSMSNPNSTRQPDTYRGTYWASTSGGDNGGVHTNSGVMNYWFYLMVEGGSGVNDNGVSYNINGLGWDRAEKIAFRNLTIYLNSNSNYSNTRTYAIKSAEDLYGVCSQEAVTAANAWNAVGVGSKSNCDPQSSSSQSSSSQSSSSQSSSSQSSSSQSSSSGGNCGNSVAWNASSIYVGGNEVAYNGHIWKAKWWTRGEEPGTTGQWGVWQNLGKCDGGESSSSQSSSSQSSSSQSSSSQSSSSQSSSSQSSSSGGNCGNSVAWNASSIYVGGNEVAYNGHIWKAKWWTRGEEPGSTGQWGVWQDLGSCTGIQSAPEFVGAPTFLEPTVLTGLQKLKLLQIQNGILLEFQQVDSPLSISIMSLDGRVLRNIQVPAGESRLQLSTANLKQGLYFLRMENKSQAVSFMVY